MLPPPTTMAICTLRASLASATSSANRLTTTASMPEPMEESANASPESLSSTLPPSALGHRGYSSPTLTRMKRVTVASDPSPDSRDPTVTFGSRT